MIELYFILLISLVGALIWIVPGALLKKYIRYRMYNRLLPCKNVIVHISGLGEIEAFINEINREKNRINCKSYYGTHNVSFKDIICIVKHQKI